MRKIFILKITVANRSSEPSILTLLPTLWFRNRWMFGLTDEHPSINLAEHNRLETQHKVMGNYSLYFDAPEKILFTENETNNERLFNVPNQSRFVKDSFHHAVINNDFDFLKDKNSGTKAAPMYVLHIDGQQSAEVKLRFCKGKLDGEPFNDFNSIFSEQAA